MHELLDTLTNPTFWQGFAAASLVALIAGVMLATLISRANEDIALSAEQRHSDAAAWPGRAANSPSLNPRRAQRDRFRRGPL
ncbi:hypothetical protein H9645_03740 [Luteimonas sp. Sa2BVA3]|uniref:Uncharacterized protein n=1 Tax=Luteimonas colneyensis TaxID=2762230 RepID=A0ABR8UHL9_9GAMM|nr:hypothetical protein [Luteimonas colneyensis]MBD7987134.1 hypothetical protein [Luteimonas colneyensis]